MLQIKRSDNKYVEFYPILSLDLAGEGDTLSSKTLDALPTKIYGKYIGGMAGYQPWWVYETVDKSKLREVFSDLK